jgi:endoglucanase
LKKTFIELLRKLSESHGGSASEGQVRACLRSELGSRGSSDKTGNLCFSSPGSSESPVVMLAAHMDEVGLAVHSITTEGYVRFVSMGGFWRPTLLAQRFTVLTRAGEELTGIVATKPVHLLSKSEKEGCPEIDSMFLDVGATSAAQAREEFGIRPGDPVVPEVSFRSTKNPDLFVGKAFDDRAGLAVGTQVLKSLNDSHPNTVCLAATVQEELGCRGARTVAAKVNPDVCLILEGAPADDFPGSSPEERQGALGAGPQVRVMDPSAVMNRGLVDLVLETAGENDIPCQTAVRRSGGTDAKNIHLAGEGVPCVVIGIPARYIHTPHCLLDINDCLHAVNLVNAIIQNLDRDAVTALTAF